MDNQTNEFFISSLQNQYQIVNFVVIDQLIDDSLVQYFKLILLCGGTQGAGVLLSIQLSIG